MYRLSVKRNWAQLRVIDFETSRKGSALIPQTNGQAARGSQTVQARSNCRMQQGQKRAWLVAGVTALVLLVTSRPLRAAEPAVAVEPPQVASGANIVYNSAHLYDANLHARRQATTYDTRYLLQPGPTRSRSDRAQSPLVERNAVASASR